ncbi:MAG: hypothetical protein LIP77_09190 [Planctomycetes bacterium]|nr:hypothetical protein [Planctomycetota bacterium]
MGMLSTMTSVAGATLGVYQSYQNAQLQKLQAQVTADSLESQAAVKELEAAEALKLGELAMLEQAVQGRAAVAGQRVNYAASGVQVYSGSALEVAADMTAWNEYERQKIEYQANLQSWGLLNEAALLRQDAANTRAAGVSSTAQALLSSTSSYLSLFS